MTQQPKGPIQIEIETDAELLIKLRERGLKSESLYPSIYLLRRHQYLIIIDPEPYPL